MNILVHIGTIWSVGRVLRYEPGHGSYYYTTASYACVPPVPLEPRLRFVLNTEPEPEHRDVTPVAPTSGCSSSTEEATRNTSVLGSMSPLSWCNNPERDSLPRAHESVEMLRVLVRGPPDEETDAASRRSKRKRVTRIAMNLGIKAGRSGAH